MRKVLTIIFLNIILVLVQTSFLRELFGAAWSPNLVIAFAYSLFFMDLDDLSLMSVFVGGLLLDFFGFTIVGLSPLVLTGSLILFRYIRRYLLKGWLSSFVAVFLAEIVYSAVIFGFSDSIFASWRGALSTLVFGVGFYLINSRFQSFFGRSGYKFTK